MNKYITILRGINVGGKRKILMADLKQLFEKIGAKNTQHYIQSGNIVYTHTEQDNNVLSTHISEAIKKQYGFDVPVLTMTEKELAQTVKDNPFVNDAEITQLHVTFLKDAPEADHATTLNDFDISPDVFQLVGKRVFLKCAGKYHETKLGNNQIDRKLKVVATTRNWKTTLKLHELAEKLTA